MDDKVEKLYDRMYSNRFSALEDKIDNVNKRFDIVDKRFSSVEKKFDAVNNKFDKVNDKFDNVISRLDEKHTDLLDKIEPLRNFKYRVLGAVSVIVIVLSVIISYSVASFKSKTAPKRTNTEKLS